VTRNFGNQRSKLLATVRDPGVSGKIGKKDRAIPAKMARARLTHNTETPQLAVRNPLTMYQPSQGFVTKAFAIATQMGYDPSN
jgi:hypothetical protein